MKRQRWYISGAVSSDPDYRAKFAYAEFQLKKRGLRVLNPVKHEKEGKKWSYYLRKDIRKLTKCQGIILLDDWVNSEGARLELAIAQGLGLDVMMFACITGWLQSMFQGADK